MNGFARSSAVLALAALGGGLAPSDFAQAQNAAVTPSAMAAVATTDQRFLSYNVEMAEVIGAKFWKPYDAHAPQDARPAPASGRTALQVGQDPAMFEERPPINLSNPRLRKLAAALGPAYMRVSGTWANTVYFHDLDTPAPAKAPPGFQSVLTRPQWKGVIDFAHAVGARLVTSFAISAGVRDASGTWTPEQARKLLSYTASAGGEISAAEFFNEPTMPEFGGAPAGYDAAAYARDFAVFLPFARSAAPSMRVVGPGGVGEDSLIHGDRMMGGTVLKTADLLAATPKPVFDVFSFHFYGAASMRCAGMGASTQTTRSAALSSDWFSRADRSWALYSGLRDRFEPGKPVWITETADAACGGNPWASTFLDSFRFVDQLARFSRHGVKAVFHNTLASSEYGLLEPDTFEPRPNYWAALLWHRLMGTVALDAGPSRPGLELFAQCLPGYPGGVTVLAINTSRTRRAVFTLPLPAERYTLSASGLNSSQVRLNNHILALRADDELPEFRSRTTAPGPVELQPATITFAAIPGASNPACH